MGKHRITNLRVVYGKDKVVITPYTQSPRGTRLMLPRESITLEKTGNKVSNQELTDRLAALYPTTPAVDNS